MNAMTSALAQYQQLMMQSLSSTNITPNARKQSKLEDKPRVHTDIPSPFKLIRKQETQIRLRVLSICQINSTDIFVDMFRFGLVLSLADFSPIFRVDSEKEPFRYV